MTEQVRFTYRAFLSYSHRDKAWATWLHRKLEAYRVDDDLVGRQTAAGPVPKTLRPTFLDRADFAASHSLTEQTLAVLAASQFLIVICSPNAAKSDYVNEEIRRFKAMGRAQRVIAIIVDGEPGDPARECFPPALRFRLDADGALTSEREEPIAADARRMGDGKRRALQKVVAGLLDVPLDDVRKRDAIANNFRIMGAAAVAAVFVVAAMAAGYFYWHAGEQDKTARAFAVQLAEVKALVERRSPGVPGSEKKAQELVAAAAEDDRLRRALELAKVNKTAEAEALFRAVAEEKAARIKKDSKDAAAAYRNLGAIAGLGDPKRALDAYLKAVEFDPDDIDSLLWAGWIQKDRGYLNESEPYLRRVVSIADRERNAGHEYWARLGIGDIRVARGDLGAAMTEYREVGAIADRLARAAPGNAGRQRDLSASYERVGDVLVAQDNLPEALRSFRDSLAIRDRLAKADPGNAGWQRDLSVSCNKVGDVLVAQGNQPEALKAFRDSLAIRVRLARADPGNAGWQRDLSVSYNKVGDVLVAQGNLPEALTSFRDSLAIRDRLARADPGNAGWQRDLSVSYDRVGDVLVAQGNLPEALKSFRDSLAIAERLARADPGNVRWQVDVLWSHWRLANGGDEPARRWPLIVETLRKMKAEDKLTAEQAKWLPEAERQSEAVKKK